MLAVTHLLDQPKTLIDGAIAVRAGRGRSRRSAPGRHLVCGEFTDVRLAMTDQQQGPLVHLLEEVAGVKEPPAVAAMLLVVLIGVF